MVSPLATLAAIFVVAIFILLQREDLRDRLISLFGSGDLHRTTLAMDDAAERLSNYLLMLFGVNTAFGVVIGIGLFLHRSAFADTVGGAQHACCASFRISARPCRRSRRLALAAAVDPGWSMLLWTAALYVTVELTTSQAVEPLLYGHSTGLSPMSVLVSATFWTWLWGPLGLILSTPLTLCLLVLGRHVDRLEFLDVALGDRPALTPVENFYQRMIAGDPDEAQDQAELLLKERPLSAYYDEVALEGMQACRSGRGERRHRPEQAREDQGGFAARSFKSSTSFEDVDPSGRKGEGARQGEADDERDLLDGPRWRASRSFGTRRAARRLARRCRPFCASPGAVPSTTRFRPCWPSSSASMASARARFPMRRFRGPRYGSFAAEGVAMICVTYLEVERNLPHVRHLLRRLRQRMPKEEVLVGLVAGTEHRPR